MKQDTLKQFAALRNSLANEKRQLEQRLAEINAVLGAESAPSAAAAPSPARRGVGRPRLAKAAKAPRSSASKPKRARNEISLKELVAKLTADKPMTKEEIFAAVKKTGYKFSTSKPIASLNVALYTKGLFKNNGGKFSPAK
jgi:hypothetical protein